MEEKKTYKEKENYRIGNLEFMKASYLEKKPEIIDYHIVRWFINDKYGKEKDYVKLNNEFYCLPNNTKIRIHKSCFKYKEFNVAIAVFRYNVIKECYDFEYIGDRPLNLTKAEIQCFLELIKHGFHVLNPTWYKENKEEDEEE